MIKSFCIKTNNENIINYLLKNFKKNNLDNFFISIRTFKIYENVIVHYSGNTPDVFINYISEVLAKCIIKFYENKIIKKILLYNYFYFTEIEQEIILKSIENNNFEDTNKNSMLVSSIKYYTQNNKSMILDGFVNFRIKEYIAILNSIVDTAVNEFLIEKEYNEFIALLKIFVQSKKTICDAIHLIYQNGTSILLDDKLNIIKSDDEIFKTTYVSDISFSSNDYSLNTLLNLLPRKIFAHIIDYEDEFINTIKLIFENRVIICKECNICNLYRNINMKK